MPCKPWHIDVHGTCQMALFFAFICNENALRFHSFLIFIFFRGPSLHIRNSEPQKQQDKKIGLAIKMKENSTNESGIFVMFYFGMALLCFYMFNGFTVPLYYNVNAIYFLRSRKQNDTNMYSIAWYTRNNCTWKIYLYLFVSYIEPNKLFRIEHWTKWMNSAQSDYSLY